MEKGDPTERTAGNATGMNWGNNDNCRSRHRQTKKVEEKDTEDEGDDVLFTQNLHHSQ